MSAFLVLFAVLALAGAVVAARKQARAQQELSQRRRDHATRQGWHYEEDGHGYRIRGVSGGLSWEIAPAPHRAEDGRDVVWRAEAIRASRAELLIVGHIVDRVMQSGAGRLILKLGDRNHPVAQKAKALYALPVKAETGSEDFRKRFAVRVNDLHLARCVVDRRVERLLLEWPAEEHFVPEHQLGVMWNEEALEITSGEGLATPAALQHMVDLGCTLAHNLRQ